MGRILAIDYGLKRCGLAVTDPMQMIAQPLETVDTPKLFDYLKAYCAREPVELFVIGEPRHLYGGETAATPLVRTLVEKLRELFLDMPFKMIVERLTSRT